MQGTVDKAIERLLHKRVLGRWTRMADTAAAMDTDSLRNARMRARMRALRAGPGDP